MKKVCVVQARTTSRRLPGKVLMDVVGRPMLAQQLSRLKHCTGIDEIVVATTDNLADVPIVDLARKEDVGWFRGSEHDVLARFVGAAREFRADVVIRTTADCPLLDPEVTDRVICELTDHSSECDYASNVLKRTYPRGLDVEALYLDTLLRIDRLATSRRAREHVTLVPRAERPGLFLCRSLVDVQDNSVLRWTVDTLEDLQLVRTIYEALDMHIQVAPYRRILAFLRANPKLTSMNAGIETWSPDPMEA